jgi:hypothetical protein
LSGGEDNMAIFTPTIAASNSINPIHIQFKTFDFELKRDNMVPVVPCPIKIIGGYFIKRVTGPVMPKPRMTLLQGGENDELVALQIISA